MSDIVDAAEALQNNADAIAEHAEAVTEAALDEAAQRVQAAEEAAQRITDAAVQTELGRRVETVEGKIDECRISLETKISELETRLQTLAQPAVVVSSSTPEPLETLIQTEQPTPPAVDLSLADPAGAVASASEDAPLAPGGSPAQSARPRRRLM